jgi:hypothetical protein
MQYGPRQSDNQPTDLSFGERRDRPTSQMPPPDLAGRYRWQPIRSVLSFAAAASVVCHCMFDGASAPPHASGTM